MDQDDNQQNDFKENFGEYQGFYEFSGYFRRENEN